MNVDVPKHINYWRGGAEEDLDTAQLLLSKGKKKEALFFAHLSVEKALKALVVKGSGNIPPYSHDLPFLVRKAELQISLEQGDFLGMINQYSIIGRYPGEDSPSLGTTEVQALLAQSKEMVQWLIRKL